MRELSIEQKARAYDEALEKSKRLYKQGTITESLAYIFPELKESEDEKIRKMIINHLTQERGSLSNDEVTEAIAWLEKQGKKLPVGFYYVNSEGKKFYSDTFKYGDVILHVEKQDKQKPYGQREECVDCQVNYAGECKGSCELKRNEQKPIIDGILTATNYDKMFQNCNEPKFKVGDWVFIEEVKGYKNGPFQIKTVDFFGYSFDEYHTIPFMYEDILSKWTIKDAKDGDVLATKNFVFIFKNIDGDNGVHYYCHYEIDNNQFDIALLQSLMGRVDNGFTHYSPATKEQRDFLFQKITEAGYEWDANKLELKKIDMQELVKQNPVWSEEDELVEKDIEKAIINYWFGQTQEDLLDWIKSIKQRIGE